jgi:hypothetical protein
MAFPLHFFDSVRIGLFNQSPQPGQRLSTPIAWHLNYDVYLLGSRLVFHTHLFLLRLLQQLVILHVREPDLLRWMPPEYLPVPDQSLEAGHAELVLRSPWLPA